MRRWPYLKAGYLSSGVIFNRIARPSDRDSRLWSALPILLGLGMVMLLPNSLALGDVWERGRDGRLTLHRTLDYSQRARLAADWQPPSAAILVARRQEYSALIDQLSGLYGVSAALVHAIIEVESAYDVEAVSKAGAMGLMQLMPRTVARFGVIDALDAAQNIEAGVRYLHVLLREFQDPELVLAAYNAGEEAVRRYGNQVPPYAETRVFVKRVLLVIRRRQSTDKG